MKRIRGRRVALLVASALPLLAEEDGLQRYHGNANVQSKSEAIEDILKDDDPLSTLDKIRKYLSTEMKSSDEVTSDPLVDIDQEQRAYFQWIDLNNESCLNFYPFEEFYRPFKEASRQPQDILIGNDTLLGNTSSGSAVEDWEREDDTSTEETQQAALLDGIEDVNSGLDTTEVLKEEPILVEASPKEITAKDDEDATGGIKHVAVDYASKSAGALILDSSRNFEGASNLLQKDRDKYAIVPCEEPSKYIVVGLSEDILVKQIVLANYERYSGQMKEIHLSGSATTAMGSNNWVDLGTYVTTPGGGSGTQIFALTEPTWARYLKFEFLAHEGDEFYCTISQISVLGSTVLQGFHEQWGEDEDTQQEDEVVVAIADVPEATDSEKTTTTPGGSGGAGEAVNSESGTEPSSSNQPDVEEEGESLVVSVGNERAQEHRVDVRPLVFSPTLDYCITQLNAVCPDDWDFEQKMSLFSSGNVSESDRMGALSSASVCLSSSHPATSSKSFLATQLYTNRRSVAGGPIVRHSKESGSCIFPTTDVGGNKAGIREDALTATSPAVERIRSLIRTTAGVVNLEEIRNKELRALPVSSDSDDKAEKLRPTDALEVQSKVNPETDISSVVESQTNAHSNADNIPDSGTAGKPSTVTPTDPVQQSGSVKTTETVPRREEASDSDTLHETGLALANLLQRLPSAKCLETLNFVEFKTSVLKTRSGGSGNAGNAPPGGTMKPIFKKLTDEIKTLQANVAVHDHFAKESIACYQRIMLELLMETETLRLSYDARISKIEDDLQLGAWVVTLQRVMKSLLFGSLSVFQVWYSLGLLVASRVEDDSKIMAILLLTGGVVCLVAVYCLFSVIASSRRSRIDDSSSLSTEIPDTGEVITTPEKPTTHNRRQRTRTGSEIERTPSTDSTGHSDTTQQTPSLDPEKEMPESREFISPEKANHRQRTGTEREERTPSTDSTDQSESSQTPSLDPEGESKIIVSPE